MTTIQELRAKMASTVAALENKTISAEEAMAICRAGAVVIGSLRVELQYRQSRSEKPNIDFINESPNAPHQATASDGRPADMTMSYEPLPACDGSPTIYPRQTPP